MTRQATLKARRPKAWSEGEIQALARTPSPRHDCPTVPNFFMRVSPKGVAVWAYRFKHKGVAHEKTVADVLTATQPAGITFDAAAAIFLQYYDSVKNPRPATRLGDAYADWLKGHRNRRTDGQLAPRTRQTYEKLYNYNLAAHAGVILQDTPPRYWRDVLQAIRDRAPHQARQVAMLLHSIHAHLKELKEIPENPITALLPMFAGKDLKTVRQGVVPLAGLAKFFAAIKSMRAAYQDAPMLLALTGWRMSAVLRMRWDEVDLDGGFYRVPTGGEGWKGYTGEVALGATVVELLRARQAKLKAAKQLGPWVFPGRDVKRRGSHATDISEGVQRAGAAVGVHLSPHDLRRTWSTAAHLAGIDPLTVSRLTGHKHVSKQYAPENAWTAVGAGYVIQQLRAESYASEQVATLLLELGGLRPISEATAALLARKGIEVPEN